MRPPATAKGFSLIEIVVFIVIVSTAMAGMSLLYVETVGRSYQPYLRQRALAVADAFMDEIFRKRWNENTPLGGGCVNTGTALCSTGPAPTAIGAEAGETRASYDDIDDYHGLNQSPPQDSGGAAMPGYTGFTVDVSVTQPAGGWNGTPALDTRLIQVQVTNSANEALTYSAYRLNF